MADVELNFQQCSFFSEFHILLLVFFFPVDSFYTQVKFSIKNTSIYTSLKVKWNTHK